MSEPAGGERETLGTVEHCYRHPGEETRIHCSRCNRLICPACMIPAPVGHHCPECVAEAKRAFRLGPGRRARSIAGISATRLLLTVLIGVFVVEVVVSRGDALVFSFTSITRRFDHTLVQMGALVPGLVARGQWWRLFTAMFLHIGVLHLAMNCYALWLFGAPSQPLDGFAQATVAPAIGEGRAQVSAAPEVKVEVFGDSVDAARRLRDEGDAAELVSRPLVGLRHLVPIAGRGRIGHAHEVGAAGAEVAAGPDLAQLHQPAAAHLRRRDRVGAGKSIGHRVSPVCITYPVKQ